MALFGSKTRKEKTDTSWNTKALIRKTESLADDTQFSNAFSQIERSPESAGMKHLLINWVADERLDGRKVPDKLFSRKKSLSFRKSVKRYMTEDRGTFRISGIVAAFSMVLVCSFFRNWMMDSYLVNFSVDAIVAAIGAGLALINLRTQFMIAGWYGKVLDYELTDGVALLLWFMLTQVFHGFDTSILVFLAAYIFNLVRFRKAQNKFIEENHFDVMLPKR